MSAGGAGIKRLVRRILPANGYNRLAGWRQRINPPSNSAPAIQRMIERENLSETALLELRNSIAIVARLDYAPHEIFLHVDSQTEYDTRLHSCQKEPDTVDWIERFMKPGDVFYDVGANIGAYSLVAAKCFAGAVKVYAFEPAFQNFSQLCRNILLNHCQEIVVPLSVALSGRTRIDTFNHRDLTPGGALHTLGEAIDYKGDPFQPALTQPVISYRIDDLIEQFKLPAPNHIKIDVDGKELAVLQGAAQTLASNALRSIVVELEEGDNEARICEFVISKGFQLEASHHRRTPRMLNCIFSRKKC